MTKQSCSWSSTQSWSSSPGIASSTSVLSRGRYFSPFSKVCSIETTRSRNIFVLGIGVSAGEDLAGDHDPLDLARSFVDFGDARVAEVPLDGELLRVAVAAVDLERFRRDA